MRNRFQPWPHDTDYQLSYDGEVRSTKLREPRILKCGTAHSGHKLFRPSTDGRQRTVLVHRAVYEAWRRVLSEGEIVRHLNDDPADNRLSNLVAGSHQDNFDDRVRNSGNRNAGEDNGRSVLTKDRVKKLRNGAYEATQVELAARWGVSQETISLAKNGHTWRHV